MSEALDVLAGGPPLALQLSFGSARKALEAGIAELPVEGIGIDFYATHATDIPEGLPELLLAGVIDARSSALDPEAVRAFVDRLADEREVEQIDLCPERRPPARAGNDRAREAGPARPRPIQARRDE